MGRLRAAVVGVGYLGNFHAQKYKALAEKLPVDLVGVFDLNKENAQKVAASLGCQAFSKLDELIGQIDIATVATITPAHFSVTEFLLSNRIHVNVEKPISLKVVEANRLLALAKEKDRILTVGHSERFSPVYQEVKRLGGRPLYLEFVRRAPFNPRGSDVSVVHDLMIHDLDLALSLDSSSARLVSAQAGKVVTETHDWASATIEFASGLKSVIHCSRLNPTMTRTIRWMDQHQQIVGNFQTGEIEISKTQLADPRLAFETIQTGKADNLYSETEDFVLSVLGNKTPTVPGQDGQRALEMAEQILSSVHSQRGW